MMTVRSLVLGSAAALLAMSGAQAADLPIKAKAVEYVRVCSMYGAGFFYIPGTDTCIKLGGYLRAEAAFGTNAIFQNAVNGVGGGRNRLSNYYTTRSRADLNIDTRTATEYGVVRTFFDAAFQWTGGSYAGTGSPTGATAYSTAGAPGAQADGNIAQGGIGVFFAFIQFAGFTIGKAVSQFDAPWANYPGNNFDGLTGGGGTITGVNQLTYTADFGSGITAAISLQDATQYSQSQIWNTAGQTAAGVITGAYGTSNFGGNVAPDIVGMVRVDQAWGLFQASFAAHDNHAGFFGANETTGHPADKWGFAGQLALSVKNIPTGPGDTINVQGVYTNGASRYNFQSLAPINYAMYGGSNMAGAYQSLGFAGVSDSVFGAGTQQQLTTTYGVRGAFTHNWDSFWNTAVYGSWSAVRYNATAKGLICNGAGMVALGIVGANCNPDFNISTLGVITRWTPVKNLTFSADVAWTRLDQKFAGVANAPAAAAVAKPATTYQLKDQDSVSLLLRAQRNW
ncbi:porin [Bradyrhizobium sp. 83012]|uniref:Porin n=1 Tax=Bradyrhizobium aeschynomenes TaxID=2734909 RepID=A0ABX2CNW3_9BRAD|nr:porin [Bradyrhizobium aeschynomenes]NPU13739.1 porin [Bradyrhizobium aeschynomenes]NPU68962.1 porin [Bradyrhizobium aeschynomenes]NPV22590.1 porin [Bradyrhizobium aeschynomenes]